MKTADIILQQFPGTAMISITTAGNCIGYARQTSYNLCHKGKFPIPVRKVGRKSMVALLDLIKFLESQPEAGMEKSVEPIAIEPKRRVGRPTKGEQVRRMGGL